MQRELDNTENPGKLYNRLTNAWLTSTLWSSISQLAQELLYEMDYKISNSL